MSPGNEGMGVVRAEVGCRERYRLSSQGQGRKIGPGPAQEIACPINYVHEIASVDVGDRLDAGEDGDVRN
jgi:hypothetical protein